MTTTDSPRTKLLAGTGITERRVDAAGIATAILEAGTGDDIVLLHGPGEFAAGWFEVIPALAATYHVVAPDLPGHGDSALPRDLDASGVIEWLAAAVTATCSSPPILVGRTLGGAIAAQYCADPTADVAQLVLVDTLGLVTFEPAPPFGEALQRYLGDPARDSHERLMRYCAHDFDAMRSRLGDQYEALADYAVERLRTGTALAAAAALLQLFGEPIPRDQLAAIEVPTSLIWGRHDMATPLRVAEDAGRAYGWPLDIIDNAADDPALDQPAAFVAALHTAIKPRARR